MANRAEEVTTSEDEYGDIDEYPRGAQYGKVTKNPFLNFLRMVRMARPNMDSQTVAKQGSYVWARLKQEQKNFFIALALDTARKEREAKERFRCRYITRSARKAAGEKR